MPRSAQCGIPPADSAAGDIKCPSNTHGAPYVSDSINAFHTVETFGRQEALPTNKVGAIHSNPEFRRHRKAIDMRSRPDQEALPSRRPAPIPVPVQDDAREMLHPPSYSIPEKTYKPWTLPPHNPYLFEDINVVDSLQGTILPHRNVYIASGKIISITSSDSSYHAPSFLPNEAIRIPSAGKYLTPGLIDAHVHLTSVPGEPSLAASMSTTLPVSLLRQPYQARAMLERGYTTVRDCGGATLALKEAIAEGAVVGPRLFIAGKGLSQTGGHGDRRGAHDTSGMISSCCGGGGGGANAGGLSAVVDGVPDVLRAAREQLRQGADFIKLMVGGGVASPTDKLTAVQFTPAEIRAAADVAESSDTFATAHAYTPKAIRRAVENGVQGIEHGNFLDRDTALLMEENGVYLTPTLVTYHAMADPKYAAFLPAENRAKNEAVLKAGLESIEIAHKAGVKMCLGSDLLSFLGVEQLGEFGLRAQVLEDEDVLKHATAHPAEMLGQGDRLGQVKEGFVADLLVVNENPLEDVTVFGRPEEHLLAVLKEGRVYGSRWSKLPVDVHPKTRLLE